MITQLHKVSICSIALVLFSFSFGYGQGTETFGNICTSSCSPATSSYGTRNWVGQDGSTWTATNSRTDETINGAAMTMNDDMANTYIQSGTIFGGVGNITISTQRKHGSGSGTIDILINGSSIGTIPFSETVQTTTINNVNISGDFIIRIDNNIGGSNGGGNERVAVDDVTWTAFAGSSVDNPQAFLATASSSSQIDLTATANTNTDDIVVAFNTTDTFGTPTGTYTANDAISIKFAEAYDNALDVRDAFKPQNIDENISTTFNDYKFSIESRKTAIETDEVQLSITNLQQEDYVLRIVVQNIDHVTAYLRDEFLGTTTPLLTSTLNYIPFTVDFSNSSSIDSNRFKIIIVLLVILIIGTQQELYAQLGVPGGGVDDAPEAPISSFIGLAIILGSYLGIRKLRK